MNILVITQSEWDDRRAGGNTLSNWFEGWSDVRFFSIYPRSTLPRNKCCKNYWSISTVSILKNILTPWRIGTSLNYEDYPEGGEDQTREKAIISFAHRTNNKMVYLLNELLFKTKVWQNNKYRRFLDTVKPDIVFTFGIGDSFIIENVRYIKKVYASKVVVFVADDVNGVYASGKTLRNRINKKNLDALIASADLLYGASGLLCSEYSFVFNRRFTPLFKGCTIQEPRQCVNKPIRITYAGNLLYGRVSSLAAVAQAISDINQESKDPLCMLNIYTGSEITPQISNRLNISGASEIVGRRSYSEIMSILHESDIVLHVESFEEKEKQIVRLSFSTKIMDCLQSGSTLMIIGPSNIASVDYSRYIPGAIVINDLDSIKATLLSVLSSPSELTERAGAINGFAQKHHSIDSVRAQLRNDFQGL